MYDFSGMYLLELFFAFISILYLISLARQHIKKRTLRRRNKHSKTPSIDNPTLIQLRLELIASKLLHRQLYPCELEACMKDIVKNHKSEKDWETIILFHKQDRGYFKEEVI